MYEKAKKRFEYEELYKKNEKTNNYIITIALDDYDDFFHEWDNAAFAKRGIHPELEKFLDMCSEEIPLKKNIEITFTVEEKKRDRLKESTIIQCYHNNFEFYERVEKKKIKALLLKACVLACVSIILLITYYLLAEILAQTVWTNVLLQGLTIGGWVLMWEAIHLLVFESRNNIKRYRELKRFLSAPIDFEY